MKTYYVHIVASQSDVLYVGVTSNLTKRAFEHQNELIDGFTKKYKCKRLVYFEETNEVLSALEREKQIKKWSRTKKTKKMDLINKLNPEWKDLSTSLEMTRYEL